MTEVIVGQVQGEVTLGRLAILRPHSSRLVKVHVAIDCPRRHGRVAFVETLTFFFVDLAPAATLDGCAGTLVRDRHAASSPASFALRAIPGIYRMEASTATPRPISRRPVTNPIAVHRRYR